MNDPFRQFVLKSVFVHGLLFGLAGLLVSAFQQTLAWSAIGLSVFTGVIIAVLRAPRLFHNELRHVYNELIQQTTAAFVRRSDEAGVPLGDLEKLRDEVLLEARLALRKRRFLTIDRDAELNS